MSTFVLIHGGGDVGWSWHLVEAELRARGHDVVAPDLPGDDESKTLVDYADAVVEDVGERQNLLVVGHSFGAFTATLVADRLPVDALVLLAGMIPSPGESPDEWWANTGYGSAVAEQAKRDGGLTGNADPYVSFYHDVPRELATEALSKERAHPSSAASAAPWPLDALPRRADEVRALQRGPLLPARLLPPAGARPPGHRPRRDRGQPLRRTRPPQGAGRHAGALRNCREDRAVNASSAAAR